MVQIRENYILQQCISKPQDKGGRRRRFLFLALLLLWPQRLWACDIALALAVDISGSVDQEEFRLQMDGLADALRDGTVADALVRAQAQVMLVQWTGDHRQMVAVGWSKIRRFEDAVAFARKVEAAPRNRRNYSTAIGAALEFTVSQFHGVDECKRRVIDVSGDGSSNEGVEPASLRSQLWRDGFTVNALVIEGSEADLTAYFWENVIAGENAFVMTANGFEDYAERIKLKLLREVTDQVSGHLPPFPLVPVRARLGAQD